MVSGPVVVSQCAIALSGTCPARCAQNAGARSVGNGSVSAWAAGLCPPPAGNINALQRIGIGAEIGINFEHDVVLVQLRKHDRDQPLPEGVVQGVVDRAGGDAQSRCGVAVDHQIGLRRLVLLVGGHVAQFRQRLQLGHQLSRPRRQFFGVGVFQAELVLRPADAVFHRQVLHRLHVQRDAFDARRFPAASAS